MSFTQKQIELFAQDGYLTLEDFVRLEECEQLLESAYEIAEDFDPTISVSFFMTNDQAHHSDRYFLELGDKIFFFRKNPLVKKANYFSRRNFLSIKLITPCMTWIRFFHRYNGPHQTRQKVR